MIRRHIFSMTAAIVLATAVLVVAAASGYAYWTSSGDGTGAASTGSLQAVVVTGSVATPTSLLLPGLTASAAFRATNPNHFDVTITSVTQDGDVTVFGGSGCTPVNAAVAMADQTGLSINVPANAVDWPVELDSGAVTMGAGSANGCQSATFDIPIMVSVQTP